MLASRPRSSWLASYLCYARPSSPQAFEGANERSTSAELAERRSPRTRTIRNSGRRLHKSPSSSERSIKGEPMGDKSPKAKEKSKKQDTADKNQKKAVATAKASAGSAANAKKK
jgi:hypothetical protein